MDLPVLTAVAGAWEAPMVSALEQARSGVVVVRRCVDLADLLAAASTGQARAVLLSADLRRLDREALARLERAGLGVVGMAPSSEPDQADRLQALGVRHVLAAVRELEERAANGRGNGRAGPYDRGLGDPGAALASAPRALPPQDDGPAGVSLERSLGRVIAVWGPTGAPGRTTVAVTLAAELAEIDPGGALLVDADTYGSSVAQSLGVLDDAPGVAAACRAASAGTLDATLLARLAPAVSPGFRVLTGITRADRWPELGAAGLEVIWQVSREVAAWTVVDCGFSLERDEEVLHDTTTPRRNAATLTALAAADVVLAVGAGDPIGLQRLVRSLGDLAEVRVDVRPRVVVTRVRAGAVGTSPRRRIAAALGRYAGIHDAVLVPDDRAGCDAALLLGRSLTENARSSPARLALARLALDLAGVTTTRAGVRATRRRGRR